MTWQRRSTPTILCRVRLSHVQFQPLLPHDSNSGPLFWLGQETEEHVERLSQCESTHFISTQPAISCGEAAASGLPSIVIASLFRSHLDVTPFPDSRPRSRGATFGEFISFWLSPS